MTAPTDEADAAAHAAGLHYVLDAGPGLRRLKTRNGWRYVCADGRPVRDDEELRRIKKLAIPPAWTDVWICPDARGHLQATGRDAKGRKQYRYHLRWRDVRDEDKFHRMLAFGRALPTIRDRIQHDLALSGLPREKVLAAIVQLLETTLIRVGNEEYARQNGSFGLTTLRNRHVAVTETKVEFSFQGKSGKKHRLFLRDRRLARVVRRCRDLPGQALFQYVDADGESQSIGSADVNDYLRAISGEDFTAKDFRTWAATVAAACALGECGPAATETEANRHVVEAVKSVAERLGNTPAICRKSYIHPAVLAAYIDGDVIRVSSEPPKRVSARSKSQLRPEERAVLALLQRRTRAHHEVKAR